MGKTLGVIAGAVTVPPSTGASWRPSQLVRELPVEIWQV